MELTWIGVVVGVVGIVLLRRSATALLCFLLVCSLFGGAAAVKLPALGGASIPPAQFALIFVIGRLALSSFQGPIGIAWSLKRNIFLALFAVYGVMGAYIFPRLFAGQIELAPMSVADYLGPFQGEPLHPSPQNITQAVYLIGTLVMAVCATIAARREQKAGAIVKAVLWISWIHIGFGILDLVLYEAGAADLLDLFRNAGYEQLRADVGGFHRIAGVFPEASAYATYAFALFAFTSELWLRNVRPAVTGATSTAMLLIILASTSSTGIIAVGVYAPLLAARILFVRPPELALSKGIGFGAVALGSLGGALFVMLVRPDFAASINDVFQDLVFNKATSFSGAQRRFWAQQGLDAFLFSSGLGVGPGSFRSSSIGPALLGSVGVFGTVCFLLHCWRLWNPVGARWREAAGGERAALASAAGWSAVAGLLGALISAPNPDPGLFFALVGGVALGYGASRRAPAAVETGPRRPRRPRRADKVRRQPKKGRRRLKLFGKRLRYVRRQRAPNRSVKPGRPPRRPTAAAPAERTESQRTPSEPVDS
jgi:hypothetical protein